MVPSLAFWSHKPNKCKPLRGSVLLRTITSIVSQACRDRETLCSRLQMGDLLMSDILICSRFDAGAAS